MRIRYQYRSSYRSGLRERESQKEVAGGRTIYRRSKPFRLIILKFELLQVKTAVGKLYLNQPILSKNVII